MKDDIRIWQVDSSSQAAEPLVAEPLESTSRMETERSLEEVLVRNPDMLMPGLMLVGRQTPIEGGILDLLGVDEDGRLVVFELKREKLSRDAVAQAIDYCSYLESLTETELATYIANHSGKNDVGKIDDFESWYGDRQGKQMISLRPIKMVLVGLGANARAHRMVEFLAKSGVDISLLTFNGYQWGGRMLLARQVERSVEARDVNLGRKPSDADRRRKLAERSRELGIENLWLDAVEALSIASNGHATSVGITFYLPKITLDDTNVSGSHSVVIDQGGMIRVTFYPGAVHVCLKKFQEKKRSIPFRLVKPPNAPTTKLVSEQWFCLLDEKKWATHKQALTALAKDVYDAWLEHRRGGNVS